MRLILFGALFAAVVGAATIPPTTPPNTRVRSDQYDLQPVMDDENGNTTLVLCSVKTAC